VERGAGHTVDQALASVSESLAAKQCVARNDGVIGVAVYEEDEVAVKSARLKEALIRADAKPFD